jgi:hypothetical protein
MQVFENTLKDDSKHDNGPDKYLETTCSSIGFNAFKIFGASKINTCFDFLRLCKSAGVPRQRCYFSFSKTRSGDSVVSGVDSGGDSEW